MMTGALQGISGDVDFIPGIGNQNLVAILERTQKETGLDLGVCKYLTSNINNAKKFEHDKKLNQGEMNSVCGIMKSSLIPSLSCCFPPMRKDCAYLKVELEKKDSD